MSFTHCAPKSSNHNKLASESSLIWRACRSASAHFFSISSSTTQSSRSNSGVQEFISATASSGMLSCLNCLGSMLSDSEWSIIAPTTRPSQGECSPIPPAREVDSTNMLTDLSYHRLRPAIPDDVFRMCASNSRSFMGVDSSEWFAPWV